MTPERAVETALAEMRKRKLFPIIFINIMRQYLYMMYGIGFNNGGRVKNEKPVIRYNKWGGEPHRYDSAIIAARMNDGSNTCIVKVCNGTRHTHKGYIWKYENAVILNL